MLFRRRQNQYQPTVNRLVSRRSKRTRIILWGFIVIVLGLFGWIATTGLIALNNISAKNTDDKPTFFKFGNSIDPGLLEEGDSRINILAIGIDKAAGLTDTIQIVSLDPINNQTAILSVPRDLYVTAPGIGATKVNGIYNRSSKNCTRETSSCDPKIDYGAEALKGVLENTLGINVHYFARVNFDGLRKLVDAVGGIQVYVDKPLNDPQFPNSTNTGFDPLYIPAGMQNFNGEKALKYARSRQSTSDFDRSRRQQQVILALKDKTSVTGILTNPAKLTNLISIIGSNLRTDVSIDDISKIYSIINKTSSEDTNSHVLDNSAESPLRNGTNGGGSYILYPKLGMNNFSDVKKYIQTIFPEPYIIKESAKVYLINATGLSKNTALLVEHLESRGYIVVGNEFATSSQRDSELSSNNDFPYTISLLKKRFEVSSTSRKPATVVEADVVLTVGSDYKGL